MQNDCNELGQVVGKLLGDWVSPNHPPHCVLTGRFCRLEPLDAQRHGRSLHEANSADVEGRSWTYLPYGPFSSLEAYCDWLQAQSGKKSVQLYAIVALELDGAEQGRAVGVAGYLRPDPDNGVIEIGHLNFSPSLQQTAAATEALYLLIEQVFNLGYRRCEWKCNALNEASRRAALRLGFQFEGVFRQLLVVKGRNRDTAWFSIIDGEWPALKAAHQEWLSPDNFDAQGRQIQALSGLISQIKK